MLSVPKLETLYPTVIREALILSERIKSGMF